MRVDHALYVLVGETQVDDCAGNAKRIGLTGERDAAIWMRHLFGMVVQGVFAAFVSYQESGFLRLLEEAVAQDSVDVRGAARGAENGVAQVRGEAVRLGPSVSQSNCLGEQPAASGGKCQGQEYSREHAAAMVGIVKGWIVGPEGSVQNSMLQLRVGGQHKAPAIVGPAVIQVKVQIVDRVGIVEHDARDLSGDVAHVVVAQRTIDATKVTGPALLSVQEEARRFDTAHGQHKPPGPYSAGAVRSGDVEAIDLPAILAEVEVCHRAVEAQLDVR